MTKFLLIRHATNDTVGKRLAGRMAGIHLNEEGRAQAQSLSERLSGVPIAGIYSSPLERALETAEPLARRLQLKTAVCTEFTDIEFGEWTDRTISELTDLPLFQQFNSFRSCTRIPGGESIHEVQVRMIGQLERLRLKHPEETVAVVSHGDPLKTVIAFYAGIHLDLSHRIEISPASVSVIELGDEHLRVLQVNNSGNTF